MIQKLVVLSLVVLLSRLPLFPQKPAKVMQRISGKVVFKGKGIDGVEIRVNKEKPHRTTKRRKMRNRENLIVTDSNGDFFFYAQKGIYNLSIGNLDGYVCKKKRKKITVNNKKISNVMFFLEKECKISGFVKFADGTLLKQALVTVMNEYGDFSEEVNSNGEYVVSGIIASENTKISLKSYGIHQEIDGLVLSEGDSLENIDIIVEKKVSLIGKIVDSETMLPLGEIGIFASQGEGEPIISISNEAGEFIFYNLEYGKYLLACIGTFHRMKAVEIWIENDKINQITIVLEKMTEEELLKQGLNHKGTVEYLTNNDCDEIPRSLPRKITDLFIIKSLKLLPGRNLRALTLPGKNENLNCKSTS